MPSNCHRRHAVRQKFACRPLLRGSLAFFLLLAHSLFGQSALVLSSATADATGSASLNLSITSQGTIAPAAVQWTLTYTPSQISSISVADGATATANGKSVACNPSSGSVICIAY